MVKIITNAVGRDAAHETAMWFVKLDDNLSAQWDEGPYWQGWIEAAIARALGLDWLDVQVKAGHWFTVYRMTPTLFAALLTRPIEGS